MRVVLSEAGIESDPLPVRVPLPDVPEKRRLNRKERWKSLLWAIDSAEANGPDSLRGLTIALSRVIQGQALDALLFDIRWHKKSPLDPDRPLWNPDLPLNEAGQTMRELLVELKQPVCVDLADAAVFPHVWERWRMHKALGRIGAGRADGRWRQTDNHYGVGWQPWPIVLLGNGNHSTFAAQLRGGGRLTCQQSYDFTPVLRAVKTDGEYWYRTDDGAKLEAVKLEAMAGIFVVGQRLAGIRQDEEGTDPSDA